MTSDCSIALSLLHPLHSAVNKLTRVVCVVEVSSEPIVEGGDLQIVRLREGLKGDAVRCLEHAHFLS